MLHGLPLSHTHTLTALAVFPGRWTQQTQTPREAGHCHTQGAARFSHSHATSRNAMPQIIRRPKQCHGCLLPRLKPVPSSLKLSHAPGKAGGALFQHFVAISNQGPGTTLFHLGGLAVLDAHSHGHRCNQKGTCKFQRETSLRQGTHLQQNARYGADAHHQP